MMKHNLQYCCHFVFLYEVENNNVFNCQNMRKFAGLCCHIDPLRMIRYECLNVAMGINMYI